MRYTTIFFDLDDTLYQSSTGLWEVIRSRMGRYMVERLGLPEDEIPRLRRSYYETYGTTLRGLQKHHQVDPRDYLEYVHDIPVETYLEPAPQVRKLLLSLPQQRWIFTNADANHARRVLRALDLDDCFKGIIDVWAMDFACKPEPEAYRKALELAGEPHPRNCVLLDDSPGNLAQARQMGFTTGLVGTNGAHPAAMFTISNLLELPEALPQLWDGRLTETEVSTDGR
jgi:putative hydrolase of the HAD superfamily